MCRIGRLSGCGSAGTTNDGKRKNPGQCVTDYKQSCLHML
jgi:hypothetical protein